MSFPTGGPWTYMVAAGITGEGFEIIADGRALAHVYGHGEHNESNARLIAALPEIIHSLYTISNDLVNTREVVMGDEEHIRGKVRRSVLQEAHAAIDKAMGKTP